ncbi:hypothetical protein [uncultured Fusobacterium sp.]|uniref:hypothetical protein n=1 Tax=uncultured Fusobacterium sp. TaxID=159267 RepID=UPI0027DE3B2A|nr:hypothetical protein [uncultured Fusobacterium sp.]
MKIAVVELFSKIIALFSKKSKNGEKSQEIEEKKIGEYKEYVGYIMILLLIICILGGIFPKLYISPWFYSMFEKGWDYLLNLGGI